LRNEEESTYLHTSEKIAKACNEGIPSAFFLIIVKWVERDNSPFVTSKTQKKRTRHCDGMDSLFPSPNFFFFFFFFFNFYLWWLQAP
jgi:hypothetical protein